MPCQTVFHAIPLKCWRIKGLKGMYNIFQMFLLIFNSYPQLLHS